jgi:hypothetical protein
MGSTVLRGRRTGLLAIERREDGVFLGICGLHHQQSFPDDVEVAWRLAREHWGRGYATEAATAWVDHAFRALHLPRVISIADRPCMRSLAVMRRLGMVFDFLWGTAVERVRTSCSSGRGQLTDRVVGLLRTDREITLSGWGAPERHEADTGSSGPRV